MIAFFYQSISVCLTHSRGLLLSESFESVDLFTKCDRFTFISVASSCWFSDFVVGASWSAHCCRSYPRYICMRSICYKAFLFSGLCFLGLTKIRISSVFEFFIGSLLWCFAASWLNQGAGLFWIFSLLVLKISHVLSTSFIRERLTIMIFEFSASASRCNLRAFVLMWLVVLWCISLAVSW